MLQLQKTNKTSQKVACLLKHLFNFVSIDAVLVFELKLDAHILISYVYLSYNCDIL